MATVNFKGQPVELEGSFVQKGDSVIDVELCMYDLSDIKLSDFKDKTILLNIYPSIDTPVCSASVRKFNQEAADKPNVIVLCISADLPFASKRFCELEGIKSVKAASFFRSPDFTKNYGIKILSGPLRGLAARSIVVIKSGKVIYTELVDEITSEPDYQKALASLG